MDLNLLLAIGILLLLIVAGVATRAPRRQPQHLAYRFGPEMPTRRRGRRTFPG